MSDKPEQLKTFKTFRDLKTIIPDKKTEPSKQINSPSISSKPSTTRTPSSPSSSSTTSIVSKNKIGNITKIKETSPVRDFQKIPNSITRDALPQGTFKGKSKHVYDYLWSVSRGAIQPTRFIKKSRREIKQGSGLGSMVTVDVAIEHLQLIGLIQVTPAVGSLLGNQYEIFEPDELDFSSPSISSISSLTQKVDILDVPESSISRQTQPIENNNTYTNAKTIFKTLNQDDDNSALAQTVKVLNEAAKKATGKNLTAKDFEALREIAELIITETEIARARTDSVSIYLKLAAENLRRKLYTKRTDPQTKNDSNNRNWSEVGKNQTSTEKYDEQGNYIPKPLDEEGRTEALKILNEYQSWNAPLEESKKFYIPEDWDWLMKNLAADERESERES